MKKVSHVFLDFGGCIDAPGIHSRTLFWEGFLLSGALNSGDLAAFQEAYSLADRQMMRTGEAKDLPLSRFNRLNARLIGVEMQVSSEKCEMAADAVTQKMDYFLRQSRKELIDLKKLIPISVISNFTGNLEIIMREYELHSLFTSVTESYYVGASKPDPVIFQAAQKKTGVANDACMYVGDNPVNDIAPAKALGWKALLIGEKRNCEADGFIKNLSEIQGFI